MKKIIFTLGLVALMSVGANAQSSNATNEGTKTEKSCANKKECKKACTKGETADKKCCSKGTATNGTATTSASKSCCKKSSGKACSKATENTSTK